MIDFLDKFAKFCMKTSLTLSVFLIPYLCFIYFHDDSCRDIKQLEKQKSYLTSVLDRNMPISQKDQLVSLNNTMGAIIYKQEEPERIRQEQLRRENEKPYVKMTDAEAQAMERRQYSETSDYFDKQRKEDQEKYAEDKKKVK